MNRVTRKMLADPEAVEFLRKHSKELPDYRVYPQRPPNPHRQYMRDLLQRHLAELKEPLDFTIVELYLNGLSYDDIGCAVGLTAEQIKAKVQARKRGAVTSFKRYLRKLKKGKKLVLSVPPSTIARNSHTFRYQDQETTLYQIYRGDHLIWITESGAKPHQDVQEILNNLYEHADSFEHLEFED